MAHAYGVCTHLLEVDEASAPHVLRHHGSEYTCIVVETYALDLCVYAIEEETVVGIESKRA